jgi:hypothetical protein
MTIVKIQMEIFIWMLRYSIFLRYCMQGRYRFDGLNDVTTPSGAVGVVFGIGAWYGG